MANEPKIQDISIQQLDQAGPNYYPRIQDIYIRTDPAVQLKAFQLQVTSGPRLKAFQLQVTSGPRFKAFQLFTLGKSIWSNGQTMAGLKPPVGKV